MRGLDVKITFFNYLPYECEAAEEYLEEMAEKGWMLKSAKGAYFKFKKIEPRKLRFSVDVLQKISVLDYKDSDASLEYREYCQAAGWNFVCETGKIQIFYSDGIEKAVPIHTDEAEKFKSVLKASFYSIAFQLIMIIMFGINLYLEVFTSDIEFTLASNIGLLAVFTMLTFIIFGGLRVISFSIWVIKARSQLKENRVMPYNKYKQIKIRNKFASIYGLIVLFLFLKLYVIDNSDIRAFSILLILSIIIIILFVTCVQKFLRRRTYSRNFKRAIAILCITVSIFFFLASMSAAFMWGFEKSVQNKIASEKTPLTLADFGYKGENENTYSRENKSIIAQSVYFSDSIGDNSVRYTAFQSRYPWVVKLRENRLLSKLHSYGAELKQKDTGLPGNIKVYEDKEKQSFVFVSEDRLIDITEDISGISEDEFLNKVFEKYFTSAF